MKIRNQASTGTWDSLIQLVQHLLHPLKGMPFPDFNNQYDPTML